MFDFPLKNLTLTLGQEQEPPTAPQQTTGDQGAGQGADGAGGAGDGQGGPRPQPSNPFSTMWPIILIVIVFFFIMMSGQRREKKKKETLLKSLKKGDKVQSIGGIRGTIVEVRDHELVVKVDENNNTRLRFSREAIQGVVESREEAVQDADVEKEQAKA